MVNDKAFVQFSFFCLHLLPIFRTWKERLASNLEKLNAQMKYLEMSPECKKKVLEPRTSFNVDA